ncbi:MAG TPA: glycosyltransferase family 2 protein [Candidatus Saccharimonadales bacterium]
MANKTPAKPNAKSVDKPLLSILVPVYNEEKTILRVLHKVTSLPIENYEVLVVDDASHDASKTIIDKFIETFDQPHATIKVFSHAKNRGKGAGIKTALAKAAGEYFIIQDADLEYDPVHIPLMLLRAIEDNLPVVYGSRFKGRLENMPRANFYANHLYNFLLRRMYKTQITDMHTCYKMVRTDLLREFDLTSEGFGYAIELVSKILRRGINIHELPIDFNGRTKKEGKKIGIRDGLECIYIMFKLRLSSNI